MSISKWTQTEVQYEVCVLGKTKQKSKVEGKRRVDLIYKERRGPIRTKATTTQEAYLQSCRLSQWIRGWVPPGGVSDPRLVGSTQPASEPGLRQALTAASPGSGLRLASSLWPPGAHFLQVQERGLSEVQPGGEVHFGLLGFHSAYTNPDSPVPEPHSDSSCAHD